MKHSEFDIKEILDSLKKEAFLNNSINTSKIEEISFQLRMIPENKKNDYHDFVSEFLDKCFNYGLDISDINLQDFEIKGKNSDNDKIIEELKTDSIEIERSQVSFKELYNKVKDELKDYFINYKGYFITELINDRTYNYKLIFFYENNYHVYPLRARVKNKFVNYDFEFIEFDMSKGLDLPNDHNYICIFLLMSKMNDEYGMKNLSESILNFINSFEEFYYHSITTKEKVLLCEKTNRKDDFKDEIEIVLSTYISNGRLNFEEEKIIKKLCADFKSPLIFYKILSGGFSGSKVLEIRPKKANNFENDKVYIIKYGYINDGKIKEEKDNFSTFIKGTKGFLNYTDANYVKTLHYEGILYNYAISENSKASYSFSDILKMKETPFNAIETKKKFIRKLFIENDAFKSWREDYNEVKSIRVKDLYIDFVCKEKIETSLKNIINNESECKQILENFEKISDYEIKYKESVCHGDLHTDNFFVDDEENVYLIDFGFTNKRHSVLDYTSLECSLKFKHFPFYLESDELIKIEEELLTEKTFDHSCVFTSTKRKELLDLLSLINTIRNNSITDFCEPNNNIEYFISLYLMSIRQLRYPNMNQRYAFHSTKILGEYIVKNLSK